MRGISNKSVQGWMKQLKSNRIDRKDNINNRISISMVIYLFCFMFAPPILPINFVILLSAYSIILLLSVYKNRVIAILKKSYIKKFTVLYIVFALYWLLIVIVNFAWGERIISSNYIRILYQMLLMTPIMTGCIAYIIARAEELQFSLEWLIIHFILAGVIEGVISLLMFISPVIRQMLVQIMEHSMGREFTGYILSRRVYGFANGVYDLFGWGTGLLATLPLFVSKNMQRKYIWFVPLLLLPPLLNARTGLVMFVGGILIYILFMNNNNFFAFLKKVCLLMVGISVGYFIFKWIQRTNAMAYRWIIDGVRAFWGTISNNQNNDLRLSALFSDGFWRIPSFPDIIFGTGHNVYVTRAYAKSANLYFSHSDVGYVNYLWMGGIVGSLLLYGIYFYLFYFAIKNTVDRNNRWLLILFGGSIMLFNIKGQAFTHCPATALIFSVLFYSIYLNKIDNDLQRNMH